MRPLYFLLTCFIAFQCAFAQDVVTNVKIDPRELKCLVCKASINELSTAINKLDPTKTVKIGGHRLGADGSYDKAKSVPIAKSELHLSEVVDEICHKMDSYVRALWKSNGTLTLMTMITESGGMNPLMSQVEFVQDDDLNKSLEYYCQTIMEEFDESLIKLYQAEEEDIVNKFCIRDTRLCSEGPASVTSSKNDQTVHTNINSEL